MDIASLGYDPVAIGKIHWKTNTICYGLAYDYNRTLIALSVQGPNTQIEQIHYDMQGQEKQLGVIIPRRTYDDFDRYIYSKNSHFRVFKSPIPDTNEVSMILVNQEIDRVGDDASFTYLKATSVEVFQNELYHRVKSIVYGPVLKEWTHYLYTYGLGKKDDNSRYNLCGIFPNQRDTPAWMCAGFSLGYCTCAPGPWQSLISDGLKRGLIEFPEDEDSQNRSEKEESIVAKSASPNTAVLYGVDGSERVVTPENGADFKLHEMYKLLGVSTIEVVNLGYGEDRYIFIIDGEGKLVDNWEENINYKATEIYQSFYGPDDVIVGPALYCKTSMAR